MIISSFLQSLHEAQLSFMSGHSSFSFYCATYLILYLHVSEDVHIFGF